MGDLGLSPEALMSTVVSTVFPTIITELKTHVVKPLVDRFFPTPPETDKDHPPNHMLLLAKKIAVVVFLALLLFILIFFVYKGLIRK